MTIELEPLVNRLRKVAKPRRRWALQHHVGAYRLYDRDVAEFPLSIDLYNFGTDDQVDYHAVVYDRRDNSVYDRRDNSEEDLGLVRPISEALGLEPRRVHLKVRQRMKGQAQYEKLGSTERLFPVQEGPLRFLVNLDDYLDTGLFLDHRPLRATFAKTAPGRRFLNLFSYTGSVSVAAAIGGATCTSVDMSNTYQEWAQRNFALNELDPNRHRFIRADALAWLEGARGKERFDAIFLDPPTFSNSKKMLATFDVQRDQIALVSSAMALLAPGGVLYFSNNRQGFRLAATLAKTFAVEDVTAGTIPDDFKGKAPHVCFTLRAKA